MAGFCGWVGKVQQRVWRKWDQLPLFIHLGQEGNIDLECETPLRCPVTRPHDYPMGPEKWEC